MKEVCVLFMVTVLLVFSVAANAALTTIGTAKFPGWGYYSVNLIYDDDQDLVWLDYTWGSANWQSMVVWAAGVGEDITVTLYDGYTTDISWNTGWRLPSTDESVVNFFVGGGYAGPDVEGNYDYHYGYNMVNSEFGYLYYILLGNLGYTSPDGVNNQPGWGLVNKGDFINLQPELYWSGTMCEDPNKHGNAWSFGMGNGIQMLYGPVTPLLAMAVRPGIVSGGLIPPPPPRSSHPFRMGHDHIFRPSDCISLMGS